jgi:hypothetical protein
VRRRDHDRLGRRQRLIRRPAECPEPRGSNDLLHLGTEARHDWDTVARSDEDSEHPVYRTCDTLGA